jgi:hypothetical protein
VYRVFFIIFIITNYAVSSEIQRFAQKHEERLHHHENGEAIQLLDNMGIVRRFQRKNPFELV